MHRVLEVAPFAARTDAYEMQLLCKMIFAPSFIKKQLNVRHANLITLLCGQLGWQQPCCQCWLHRRIHRPNSMLIYHLWFLVRARRGKLFNLNILWPCNGPRTMARWAQWTPWLHGQASNNLYNQQLKCGSARGRALSAHCLDTILLPPEGRFSNLYSQQIAKFCFVVVSISPGRIGTDEREKQTRQRIFAYFRTAVNFNCALKITPHSESTFFQS